MGFHNDYTEEKLRIANVDFVLKYLDKLEDRYAELEHEHADLEDLKDEFLILVTRLRGQLYPDRLTQTVTAVACVHCTTLCTSCGSKCGATACQGGCKGCSGCRTCNGSSWECSCGGCTGCSGCSGVCISTCENFCGENCVAGCKGIANAVLLSGS